MNDPTLFGKWFAMCATNDEFVENYNRLTGARISFALPARSPVERAIDAATGHIPMPKNDPRELAAFMGFCIDLFQRLPVEQSPQEATLLRRAALDHDLAGMPPA